MRTANDFKGLLAFLILPASLFFSPNLTAAEVDFSCMEFQVKGKRLVTDRYKEYDVIIRNQCPGAVYWSMCIDRLDPWTGSILESHTPSGYVEAGEKARVNLQMKRVLNSALSRSRFQEFYAGVGFEIRSAASSSCTARQCREQNRPRRAEVRANDEARLQVEKALASRLAAECPQSGWDAAVQDDCEVKVREVFQPEMDRLAENEIELREGLANIEPVECRIYGGVLLPREE